MGTGLEKTCAVCVSSYDCSLAFATRVRLCRTCVRLIRTRVLKMRTIHNWNADSASFLQSLFVAGDML